MNPKLETSIHLYSWRRSAQKVFLYVKWNACVLLLGVDWREKKALYKDKRVVGGHSPLRLQRVKFGKIAQYLFPWMDLHSGGEGNVRTRCWRAVFSSGFETQQESCPWWLPNGTESRAEGRLGPKAGAPLMKKLKAHISQIYQARTMWISWLRPSAEGTHIYKHARAQTP